MVGAVRCETISTPISLLYRELTGKTCNSGAIQEDSPKIAQLNQYVVDKFPRKITGNFLSPNKETIRWNREVFPGIRYRKPPESQFAPHSFKLRCLLITRHIFRRQLTRPLNGPLSNSAKLFARIMAVDFLSRITIRYLERFPEIGSWGMSIFSSVL